ncbi:hypothetical protein Tco_0198071 [Tanacetum coccineum]
MPALSISSSSLVVTSFGLSFDVSDAGLPSEKVMASAKNGDDGDLLLFRDGLGTDNAKISRKRSKSDKHGHGNGRAHKEPGKCYQRST